MTNSRRVAETSQKVDALEALGLASGEAVVLGALVRHPHSAAPELAEAVELPPARVAQSLTGLVARGLATRTAGSSRTYVAAAPDVGLAALVDTHQERLRRARDEIDRLAQIHREATRFTHPSDLVEVLRGQSTIAARVLSAQEAARVQIRGFDKPPFVTAPPHNFEPQKARLAAGIRYRCVYDREATQWPGYLDEMILPLARLGEQSRVAADLPMKLFLVDDRTAIIPITSSEHVIDAAYVVHPCALLDALVLLFELIWTRAVPIGTDDPARTPGESYRPLLTLLAGGATDAGIARALGWSMRTTQRRVHALLTELQVSTRFQAGLAARERGWV